MRKLLGGLVVLGVFFVFSFIIAWNHYSASGAPPPGVTPPTDYIRGKVHVVQGSAAGVWVIAETTENPIYRKIVVTDDKGNFVIPELPYATYSLWVRGNCLKDSTPIQVTPGPNSVQLHVQASPAEWTLPNDDLWQHRRACSEIDSSNVGELSVAWTRELTATSAYGALASMSLITDGTVYIMDNDSNIAALDLQSGDTKWTREYNQGGIGPNGLTLYQGTLYGFTSRTGFALDPADGSELWRRDIPHPRGPNILIAPQVHDGRIYAGTIVRPGGGTIFVLDAETGDVLWDFNTLKDPSVIPANVASGGVWYTPLIDPDGNVYYGISNAYITPRHALENPDPILYTNSIMKLDSETGELLWYYQAVPNDFYDWDMQISPVYVDDEGDPIVIGAGKMGYVYAFNPDDGTLLWKTAVGDHNGHDDDPLNALLNPGSVVIEPPLEIQPGVYGGVESNMAYQDGVLYVAISNLATTLIDLDINYGGATGTFDFEGNEGEMVAIDVATGEILWSTRLPSMALGAATISNDLVFTTTFEDGIFALSREDGSIVWQDDLPTVTNAPITIAGDTLVTASSYPLEPGQTAQLVVYRLGASGGP